MSTHLPSTIPAAAHLFHAHRSLVLPLVLGLLPLSAAHGQWQTYQTDPPQSLNWVHYNPNYNGAPPNDYRGAWNIPNQWPGAGASVTIRHEIALNNGPYYPTGNLNAPVEPFPGGTVFPGPPASTAGRLTLSVLNIMPGGWLMSTLEELAFDGVSVWSGGTIGIGTSGNQLIHNQGQLSVTGPFVLSRSSRGMLNTEHMQISSSFGMQGGALLRNLSGALPDDSVAEIILSGPGAGITEADGGGGAHPLLVNEGLLRKTGAGTASIKASIENHAESTRNRAGTFAIDSGTLMLDGESRFYGLKAEIAPGALMVVTRQTVMEAGDTRVTGGGVLRLQPAPGNMISAPAGVTATLSAQEGALESAGGGGTLRNFINKGSLNVTAPSNWWDMINDGHVRLLADVAPTGFLQNGTPASHTAVLDMEGTASITGNNLTLVHNHALLRKKGPGTSQITLEMNIYGGADPLAGRIEVQEGTLQFPSSVTFVNGGRIRVAHGAVAEMLYRNYLDGGTLTATGSGKFRLSPGSFLSPLTTENPGTINFAPGVFDLNGGSLYAPVTNAGELTVNSPTNFFRTFIGDNIFTNSGTMHCSATSAGAGNSITLAALVRIVCTPASVLSLDLAGRPAQTDQWARIGEDIFGQSSISCDGTLRINFGSFTPVSGDRWQVLQFHADANTGDFVKVEFTNVPAGFSPVSQKVATGYLVGLDAAPAPVTYATWTAQYFPTPAAGAFDVDSDGDGMTNGIECALGSNPTSSAWIPAMAAVRLNSGGDIFLAAQFIRPGGAGRATDIQWIGERTNTLGAWTSDGVIMEVGPLDAQGRETITVRLAEPMDYTARSFVRLRVQKMP